MVKCMGRPLRIAVTGGTGFIGSRLMPKILDCGHDVVSIQRRLTKNSKLDVFLCDLDSSESNLESFLTGCDVLINLAAYIPKDNSSFAESEKCMRINALSTLRLLSAAENSRVGHFVHVSTAALYAPSNGLVTESSPLLPNRAAAYLASKLAAEVYVANAIEARRIKCSVLRLSSVYGDGMSSKGLVPECVQQLQSGRKFVIADNNRYRTDLVYVDDVVAGILNCLHQPQSGRYNIASGNLVSPLQIARTIAKIIGANGACIGVDRVKDEIFRGNYGRLSIQRAKSLLDFTPTPLSVGLEKFILKYK